jgi:sialate O-acetylesterase
MRGNLSLKAFCGFLLLACVVSVASADVTLPAMFSDHMVLQRDIALPVWGWADAGENVTVNMCGQTKSAKAGDKGKWSVTLTALKAGGPHTLNVQGNNTIEIADVLVGEVWLCSGQSNMAMSVSRSANFAEEQKNADHPLLRMLTVQRVTAETPQDKFTGDWQICNSETVGGFSATAYFFGRELHQKLDVPVGLINSSWGGTPVQAWTCLKTQQTLPELKPLLASWEQQIANWDPDAAKARYTKQVEAWKANAKKAKEEGTEPPRKPRSPSNPRTSPHRPASLFNGMIAPLASYAIRGAIWYQGESNAGGSSASLYGLQLATMIKNWRMLWDQGDFPFEWVQLPNFRAPQTAPVEPSGWVTVQEQMLKTLAVPNTGMAITIDVGEADDIHPKNKQDVGKRLAFWALGTTYGKDIVYSGPIYKSMCKKEGTIVIEFDHVGGGLVAKGDKVKGFAIAGEDKEFVFAEAKIVGDTVVVSCPKVKAPVAIRYAWAANPDANLFNKAGLPASPFRTDEWDE